MLRDPTAYLLGQLTGLAMVRHVQRVVAKVSKRDGAERQNLHAPVSSTQAGWPPPSCSSLADMQDDEAFLVCSLNCITYSREAAHAPVSSTKGGWPPPSCTSLGTKAVAARLMKAHGWRSPAASNTCSAPGATSTSSGLRKQQGRNSFTVTILFCAAPPPQTCAPAPAPPPPAPACRGGGGGGGGQRRGSELQTLEHVSCNVKQETLRDECKVWLTRHVGHLPAEECTEA